MCLSHKIDKQTFQEKKRTNVTHICLEKGRTKAHSALHATTVDTLVVLGASEADSSRGEGVGLMHRK